MKKKPGKLIRRSKNAYREKSKEPVVIENVTGKIHPAKMTAGQWCELQDEIREVLEKTKIHLSDEEKRRVVDQVVVWFESDREESK